MKVATVLVFGLMAAAFSLQSSAETLPDPTRPPSEASMDAAATGKAAAGPALQSVKIAPGRRIAVIDGRLVKEGDAFGDAKLIKINEADVVLLGPNGRQTLKLFPEVEKTPSSPQRARPKPMHNTERKTP